MLDGQSPSCREALPLDGPIISDRVISECGTWAVVQRDSPLRHRGLPGGCYRVTLTGTSGTPSWVS